MRKDRLATRRSYRACRSWVGPSAATCGSSIVGARAMPNSSADTRRNWSRSRRTSSWLAGARSYRRCCRRLAPCRSCSRGPPIRLGPASSKAWRGRGATPPVLRFSNMASAVNGHVTRAAVIRDPALAAGLGQWGAIQSVAPSLGVEVRPLGVRDAGEIERAVTAFARSSNGGLIVTGSTLAIVHRELITTLAARHRLPAVYNLRLFVTVGGLISYGPDSIDPYRHCERWNLLL